MEELTGERSSLSPVLDEKGWKVWIMFLRFINRIVARNRFEYGSSILLVSEQPLNNLQVHLTCWPSLSNSAKEALV